MVFLTIAAAAFGPSTISLRTGSHPPIEIGFMSGSDGIGIGSVSPIVLNANGEESTAGLQFDGMYANLNNGIADGDPEGDRSTVSCSPLPCTYTYNFPSAAVA